MFFDLSVNGSLDNSILLNRRAGVHFVYYLPATKSTKNQKKEPAGEIPAGSVSSS
jgi:hypothetical protein